VVAAGGLPNYESKLFPVPGAFQQLPLIMIEETAADPAAVAKTLELVVAQADVTLRNLQQQANVPADQMVTPFVVSPPTEPAVAMPSRTRSTIATFAAGAGLAVLITVLADVLLTRRKSRAHQRQLANTEVAAGPDPVHPQNDVHTAGNAAPSAEGVMDSR
jgi:hypothetical protein